MARNERTKDFFSVQLINVATLLIVEIMACSFVFFEFYFFIFFFFLEILVYIFMEVIEGGVKPERHSFK